MAGKKYSSFSSPHQALTGHTHLLLSLLLLTCQVSQSAALPHQLSAEWHGWKLQHGKGYSSEREEVYRHVVWQSNKKFIEAHNLYNKTFGYTLAMNEMGDLVSTLLQPTILNLAPLSNHHIHQ